MCSCIGSYYHWDTRRCEGQNHILICGHNARSNSQACRPNCLNPGFGAKNRRPFACTACMRNDLTDKIQTYATKIRTLRRFIAEGRLYRDISMQQIDDAEDEIAEIEARMRWEGGGEFFERWRRGEFEPPAEMADYFGREIRPCIYRAEPLHTHNNPHDWPYSREQNRYSSYDDDFEELGTDQVDLWARSHGLPGPRIIITESPS